MYVGDAAWDLRAAARLGFGFIGVDADGDGTLRALGAPAVVRGIEPLELFLRALVATAPASP